MDHGAQREAQVCGTAHVGSGERELCCGHCLCKDAPLRLPSRPRLAPDRGGGRGPAGMSTTVTPPCSARSDAKAGSGGEGCPVPPILALEVRSQAAGSPAQGPTQVLPPALPRYPLNTQPVLAQTGGSGGCSPLLACPLQHSFHSSTRMAPESSCACSPHPHDGG